MGRLKKDTNTLRAFLEKAGILFPKGHRAPADRRSGMDRRSGDSTEYFAAGGVERRDYVEMRVNDDRRMRSASRSPLDGML